MVTPVDPPIPPDSPGNADPTPQSARGARSDPPKQPEPSTSPRNAATVVLVRPSVRGVEVYMLRRSAKSPFMPSTLVFPGGRVDPDDGDITNPATWEQAAMRECREEAGLDLVGRPLTWFDTWLTPSLESSRRYLARFFLTALAAGEGDDAQTDGHETHAGRWATVAEHIAGWDAAEIDLPPPTLCILLQLRDWAAGSADTVAAIAAAATAQAAGEPILPKVTADGGTPTIVMPHDPLYPGLPGEGLPAPARASVLPKRFSRTRGGWRPQ